jgi:hypothetical protein
MGVKSGGRSGLMKKITALAVMCLCLGIASSAGAHAPGLEFTAFQFPPGLEPTLDGDASEWSIIPEDYVIPYSAHTDGEGQAPTDFGEINFNAIVGWAPGTNKIYWLSERYDDFWDHDDVILDDGYEWHIDADHGGGLHNFGPDDIEDEEERARAGARYTQGYHTFPPYEVGQRDWSWLWASQATWADSPPYSDLGWSMDGQLNGEGTGTFEIMRTGFDDLLFDDPEGSTIHQFAEGEVAGIGWFAWDSDIPGEDYEHESFWYLGATDMWHTADAYPDFLLAPVDPRVDFQSAVESESWGRIKSAFVD